MTFTLVALHAIIIMIKLAKLLINSGITLYLNYSAHYCMNYKALLSRIYSNDDLDYVIFSICKLSLSNL